MPYDKNILQEILLQQDCRTIESSGKIFPPTNPVFKLVANRMALRGSIIQPRHVYTIVNEDRNGFRTLIMETHNIQPGEIVNGDTSAFSAASQNDTNASLSDSVFSRQIKLVLSAEKWSEIIPKKKISGGRLYWKLQEGWGDIIAERICQQHGSIDCVFSFKNNLVTPSGTAASYAKFVGHCVECEAKITGRLQKKPGKDVDVIFVCDLENIRPALHKGTKKRQLRGKRREKVANQSIDQRKDAVIFQREEAKRMKKFGGKNLPIIPHAATLRKAKEQQLLKLLGLESANPSFNLLNESKNGKFAGSIHSISILNFYCMYWLPEQQQIYTARCRGNPDCILTIDATGGVAKRLNNHDPHVFLYQCMVVTKEGSVPVFQMVSADQRSFIIGQFLKLILTKGVPRPPTVVCDFGRALVNAVAQEFGKCNDLQEYLQKCYDCVARGVSAVPATYIRLDVSHFVAMVARWKCLDTTVIAARRFYMRCVCQIYQTDDFKTATSLIESVLAVALSESIGFTTEGQAVPSEMRMQTLTNAIKGVTSNEIENYHRKTDDSDVSEDSDTENDTIDTDWNAWANSRYLNAEAIANRSKEGSVINACCNPGFAQRFKKQLLPFLPLWTNIMRKHFGRGETIATSSSAESEFADIKTRASNGKVRVDKFVLQHLDYLDGKVKLASNERDLPRKEPEAEESTLEDSIEGMPTTEEPGTDHVSDECETFVNEQREDFGNMIPDTDGQLKVVERSGDNTGIEELDPGNDSQKNENVASSIADECSIWNSCEDWRGKAVKELHAGAESEEPPVKKRRKPSYLDTCPEWDYIKNTKVSKLPSFKNGLFCQPVIMGNLRLNLKRTCAFDTLFQLIMSAMASNHVYCKILEESTNRTIQLARKILVEKQKISASDYSERADILLQTGLFPVESFTRKIKQMDTECNVAHLAQYIFSDIPSYKTKIVCQCGYNVNNQNVIFGINVDVILRQGLGSMQQAIDDGHETQRMCRKCKQLIDDDIEYGPHLIIDTSVITDSRYTNRNEQLHHTLGSMANFVTIKDKTYYLAGAAHWSAGHYTAFSKSGMFWHEYNDIGPTRDSVNAKKALQPHLILYTLTDEKH